MDMGLPSNVTRAFIEDIDNSDLVFRIMEQSPLGVLLVNSDQTIEYANSCACRIMDTEPNELVGKKLPELFGEEFSKTGSNGQVQHCVTKTSDRKSTGAEDYGHWVLDQIADLFQHNSAHEFEVRSFTGSERTLELTDGGQIGGCSIWYMRDVTAKRQLEIELRYRDAFFHNLIDSSVDGIIASDKKGNIILFNSGAQNILGYTREEALKSLHVTKLYPEGEASKIIQRMRSHEHGGKGKLLRHELIAITKKGKQIPMSLSGGIIYDDDAEIASYGIFTDLRAIRKAEEDLQQTHQMLLQSEKMAGLGRLAAGVAHEINNPMSGIMLYANLAMEQISEDQPIAADLKVIIQEAERCKQIVTDLLEFSHQTSYEQTGVDLGVQIRKTLSLLDKQPSFQNIQITLDIERDLSRIRGNPIRLNQVFMNIMVNAAQAMDGRGELTIQARHRSNRGIVEVSFQDTGPGIPKEIQAQIFDPFFTTKNDAGGTGLGLSVSYAIIREHSGSVRVKSEPGEGTTFTLRFPVLRQEISECET